MGRVCYKFIQFHTLLVHELRFITALNCPATAIPHPAEKRRGTESVPSGAHAGFWEVVATAQRGPRRPATERVAGKQSAPDANVQLKDPMYR